MTIQWFPGHMAKARREVQQRLKLVDVVIELLDARLPMSSRNPMMDDIVKDKPRLVLLNKSDLADAAINREWLNYFADRSMPATLIDARSGTGIDRIPGQAAQLMEKRRQSLKQKGLKNNIVRCLIVGIPNVGKSSLINRLAGRNAAKTGDRPGITQAQQWIKVGKQMQLLDTPGILWPKFDDPEIGQRLAASGAIKDDILPLEEVAVYVLNYLRERYPEELLMRYRLDAVPEDAVQILETIGEKRGCLVSGGTVNLEKAADVLLRDLRSGKLGRISLEYPEDWRGESE